MFKNKGNYPYPLIQEKPVDYKSSTITAKYYYKPTKEEHIIVVKCTLNNQEIANLISEKKVCYAVQIESPKAFYRKMFEFYEFNEFEIHLKVDEVIDSIEFGIGLLAKENIPNFSCDDFLDDYKGTEISIEKNEIIGVVPSKIQRIALKDELLKSVSNIFQIAETTEKMVNYSLKSGRILVNVPKEICTFYKKCEKDEKITEVINSLVFLPVLTSVLGIMKNNDYNNEDYSSCAWYKTLENHIKKMSCGSVEKEKELYENSLGTAQLLMKGILFNSVKSLENKLLELNNPLVDYDEEG